MNRVDIVSLPQVLYRGFTQISHAQDFAHAGRFRLGRLDTYQHIEDNTRADNDEGMGHYVSPDGTSEHFKLGNPIYLLCCANNDVDIAFLRKKMGPFIVRISQPDKLVSLIDNFLKERHIKTFGGIKGAHVQYNKGQIVHDEFDAAERTSLSIIQKPPRFSEEQEYRLYAVINIECPFDLLTPFLSVDLGCALPFVELLPCEELPLKDNI